MPRVNWPTCNTISYSWGVRIEKRSIRFFLKDGPWAKKGWQPNHCSKPNMFPEPWHLLITTVIWRGERKLYFLHFFKEIAFHTIHAPNAGADLPLGWKGLSLGPPISGSLKILGVRTISSISVSNYICIFVLIQRTFFLLCP